MSTIGGVIGPRSDPAGKVAEMMRRQSFRSTSVTNITTFSCGAFGNMGCRPVVHEETGATISADIRLDNCAELVAMLPGRINWSSHAELALLAYLHWGPLFAARLVGDFAIAIWDPREQLAVLCRDHFGIKPIAYTATEEYLVFASTVMAVEAGSARSHRINTPKLEDFLFGSAAPLEAANRADTELEGISYLTAALALTWRPGGITRAQRYWTLSEQPELKFKDDRSYAEAFQTVLDDAVRCRLGADRSTSAMLSGGVDSSLVVTTAAAIGGSDFGRAYGAIDDAKTRWSDAPYILDTAAQLGIELVEVTFEDMFDRYDPDFVLAHSDALFGSTMVIMHAIFHAAQSNGETTMLTGIGGDELTAILPYSVAYQMAKERRWRAALTDVLVTDRQYDPILPFLKRIGTHFVPSPLLTKRRLRRQDEQFASLCMGAGIKADSTLGKRVRRSSDSFYADPFWNTASGRVDMLRHPFIEAGVSRYERTASLYGIELRHPLLDVRVAEFCLSLPLEQLRKNGWTKWILRASMQQRLDTLTTWRPKSNGALGPFAEEWQSKRPRPNYSDLVIPPFDLLEAPIKMSDAYGLLDLMERRDLAAVWMDKHAQRGLS